MSRALVADGTKQGSTAVPDHVRVESALVRGEPASELAEVATVHGGVLLVRSRGYGALRHVLLGSVSAAHVRSAPCPLVVPPGPVKEDWRGPDTYAVARGRL